uniref:Uncharacterized protein n=1 Tax=Arundo donax TaxID=35708 RepID=A0A0A9CDB7_ARUDO
MTTELWHLLYFCQQQQNKDSCERRPGRD